MFYPFWPSANPDVSVPFHANFERFAASLFLGFCFLVFLRYLCFPYDAVPARCASDKQSRDGWRYRACARERDIHNITKDEKKERKIKQNRDTPHSHNGASISGLRSRPQVRLRLPSVRRWRFGTKLYLLLLLSNKFRMIFLLLPAGSEYARNEAILKTGKGEMVSVCGRKGKTHSKKSKETKVQHTHAPEKNK